MKPRAAKWELLNWNLPNKLLAEQTGAHHKTVNKWRKRLKQVRSDIPLRKFKGFIDWTKTNRELARKHGVTKEYVSNFRKRWGAPPSPDCNALGPMKTRNGTKVNWTKNNTGLARELKCGRTTIRRARQHFCS